MKTTNHVVVQANQKGLKFYANKRQAKKVFGDLIQRLSEKGPPYHKAHVPQAEQFLPLNMTRGSKEHAIFLFVLCFWMRGGVESDTAASFLKKMYENRPDVFVPDNYWDFGPDLTTKQIAQITEVMREYNLGQRVKENAPGWVYNMRKLANFWGGDPRSLVKDRPSFKKLAHRMIGKTSKENGEWTNENKPNGFMFFREKMTSMITYFLMDAGLVPMFYTPVPVDFHVLRILVSNQIIRVRGKGLKETIGVDFMPRTTHRLAREITEWYCRTFKISPVALCDSLWLLSRTLCRLNPGNSGYVADDRRKTAAKEVRKIRDDHPTLELESLTDDEVAREIGDVSGATAPKGRKRYMGLRNDPDSLIRLSMVDQFDKSCGVCPLQSSCRYNISAGAYYVAGMLLPERSRFIPPDSQEHFLNHPEFEKLRALVDPTVRFAKIHLEA